MTLDRGKRESQLMKQFPALSQFADAGPLERRDSQVLLRKDLDQKHKNFTVSLSPVIPQRNLRPFTRITVCWGKGSNQPFQGLLDTGSELMLILGAPKKCSGPQVKVRAYRSRMIDGVLAKI